MQCRSNKEVKSKVHNYGVSSSNSASLVGMSEDQ